MANVMFRTRARPSRPSLGRHNLPNHLAIILHIIHPILWTLYVHHLNELNNFILLFSYSRDHLFLWLPKYISYFTISQNYRNTRLYIILKSYIKNIMCIIINLHHKHAQYNLNVQIFLHQNGLCQLITGSPMMTSLQTSSP